MSVVLLDHNLQLTTISRHLNAIMRQFLKRWCHDALSDGTAIDRLCFSQCLLFRGVCVIVQPIGSTRSDIALYFVQTITP